MDRLPETLAQKERRLRTKGTIGDWFVVISVMCLVLTVTIDLAGGRTITQLTETVKKMSTPKK